MNVYLVGFMGSGKSFIGKALANQFSRDFLDLDDFIEQGEGTTINHIFSDQGEIAFRALEKVYLEKTQHIMNTVIALGGGTVCNGNNLEWCKKNGIVIYLNVKNSIIFKRLKEGRAHRPLINEMNDQELLSFIESKVNQRKIYYNQAHIRFDIDNADMPLDELYSLIRRFEY